MKKILGIIVLGLLWSNLSFALPECVGEDSSKWTMCESTKIYSDGKKYIGEWKHGKRNGTGQSILPDGTTYAGEFKDDQATGNGTSINQFNSLTVKYIGQWINSTPNGQGTLTCLPEGIKVNGEWEPIEYKGQWKDGKLRLKNEGHKIAFVSAEECGKMVGEWDDELKNGEGVLIFPDGSKATGVWKNESMNGQGTFTFYDGSKYVGEYKYGKRNGQGTFTWLEGKKYVGEWKNGELNGQGTMTLSNGIVFKGTYRNSGATNGTLFGANGEIQYIGQFKDNNYNDESD